MVKDSFFHLKGKKLAVEVNKVMAERVIELARNCANI